MGRSYPIVRKEAWTQVGASVTVELTDEEYARLGHPNRVLVIIEAAEGPLSAKGEVELSCEGFGPVPREGVNE